MESTCPTPPPPKNYIISKHAASSHHPAMWWSHVRVRPHKMSGWWLACFWVGQVWVAARSDAPCVCMCARGRGNALFEHVFRSCGCHRGTVGLKSSSKIALLVFSNVAEQGIGSRGHALAVGPSHLNPKPKNFRRRDWPRSSRLSCRSSRDAIPLLAFWCVSSTSLSAPSLFLFSFRRPWFSRMDLVPLRFSGSRCLLQQDPS